MMNGFIGGQYKPLSEKNIVKIHETSLRILEEIRKGALEEALQVFKKHGAKIDGEIVRIPLSTVEEALKLVPHEFLMAGREEKNDLYLEDKRVYLGTGGAALTVLDLEEEVARPGTLQDIAQIAKLVDALENVHFYLSPVFPRIF
jgi:trimethylamine--corrinoid protein Co-methyltransferase